MKKAQERKFYPAVFTKETEGFSVHFPDLDGCFTEGDSMSEAYENAQDAIGLYAEDKKGSFVYPDASSPQDIKVASNEFVVVVEFSEHEYKKKHSNRSVKKTLTIPEWLNEEALDANINFSNLLQEALKDKLKIN